MSYLIYNFNVDTFQIKIVNVEGEYKERSSSRAVQVSSGNYKNGCHHHPQVEPIYHGRGTRYFLLYMLFVLKAIA